MTHHAPRSLTRSLSAASIVFSLLAACSNAEPHKSKGDASRDDVREEEEEEPRDAGGPTYQDPCATRACRVRWLRGLGSDIRYPNLWIGAARFSDDGSLTLAGNAVAGGVIGAPPFLSVRGSPDVAAMDSFFLTLSASGVAGEATVFGQALGDGVSDLTLAADGDRVLAGYTGVTSVTSGTGSDVEINRFSASGEQRWRKAFGSSVVTCNNCPDEYASRVVVDPSGKSYVFGKVNGTTQVDALSLAAGGFVLALGKAGEALWRLALPAYLHQVSFTGDALYAANVDFDRALGRDQLTLSKIALDGTLLWQAVWSSTDPMLTRLGAIGLALDPVSRRPTVLVSEQNFTGDGTQYGKTFAISYDPATGAGELRELPRDRSFQAHGVLLLDDGEWLAFGRESFGKSWKVGLHFWSTELKETHKLLFGDDRSSVERVQVTLSEAGAIAVFGSVGTGTVWEPAPIFSAGSTAVQARDLSFVFLLER
jgi:hypothetical protein